MNMQASGSTFAGGAFLLQKFREFYVEVIRLKAVATSGATGILPDGLADSTRTADSSLIMKTWQSLVYLLEQQAVVAARQGDQGHLFREAQYVMAVLADEIFLNLEWEGKSAWKERLLELYFFQTRRAGDLFFQKLEALLLTRDTSYAELAAVYLMALSLGFQGRYRGDHDAPEKLDLYRAQLFSFIFQRAPELLSETNPLFSEAYQHTITRGAIKKLPNPKVWVGIFAGTCLVLLLISHLLWSNLTSDLYPILSIISHTP